MPFSLTVRLNHCTQTTQYYRNTVCVVQYFWFNTYRIQWVVYITHPWGVFFFQARLLYNQEGANTERYVFG